MAADDGSALSLPDLLRRRAERSPQSLALQAAGAEVTYAALDHLAARAAGSLRAAGVAPGDRVAVLLQDPLAFAVLWHALWRLGAAIVPLNTRLAGAELESELRDAAPRLFIAGGRHRPLAQALAERLALPVWLLPDGGQGPDPLAAGPAAAPCRAEPDAAAAIVYTSGTTGAAKGAILTRGNFFHAAVTSAMGLGALPDDRWLLCMPLFHVGGLSILVRSALFGGAVLAHSGFAVDAVRRGLEEDGATCISLVPVMLGRLLEAKVSPPAQLRFALLGGSAAPGDLIRRGLDAGWPLASTYGLTETASQAATLPPADAPGRVGSAGRPLFLTEIRIAVDGRDAAPGEPGEILVRGPTVSPGYLNGPPGGERRTPDGFLRTGDLGYLDDDGYLYVLDRRDDLIVSGGENIYPAEVEAALRQHPGVSDAAVFPRADAVWGQVPIAAVVPRSGSELAAEDLLAFLRGRLARYKVPQEIRFVADLPRNAAGKLVRRALREGDGR